VHDDAEDVPVPALIARVTGVELRRLVAIRSNQLLVALSIVAAVAVTYLDGSVTAATGGTPSSWTSLTLAPSGVLLILCGLLGASAFGSEYRHGSIRLTASIVRSRTSLFMGKLLASLVVSTAVTTFAVLSSLAVIRLSGGPASSKEFLQPGTIVLYFLTMMAATLISFAVSVLCRSQVAAATVPIAVGSMLEPLLDVLLGGHQSILNALPYNAARAAISGQATLVTTLPVWQAFGVFAMYSSVLVAASFGSFARRAI
jgi:ABC-type transport system involved in multi-copper enzyme maturation permease subunit